MLMVQACKGYLECFNIKVSHNSFLIRQPSYQTDMMGDFEDFEFVRLNVSDL